MAGIEIIEGAGGSQLRSVIKQLGYNKDVDIEFGTVTAPPPSIRVQVNGMKFELEADDLVIPESLTKYTRKATISGGSEVDLVIDNALKAGDRVIVASVNRGQIYVILDRIGGD
ncbi:DUF2577 domain-containing protein [Paenibacillus sp. SN-8-1]|uniref:DUF2577 domain-containing protein n=1 Tax=Paenibacillus sp. SN-8-1 TaxID=3435409 RepID=UPI003D9AA244